MFKMYILIFIPSTFETLNPMRKIPKFATLGVLFTDLHYALPTPAH